MLFALTLQVGRHGGAHTCHTGPRGSRLSVALAGFFGLGHFVTKQVDQCVAFARGHARTQACESAAAGRRTPLSLAKLG